MKTKSLSTSLIQTISKSELPKLVTDYSEIELDSVLDDGIVKDIPIIRSIVGLYKTTITIRDRIFMKKILLFLGKLQDVDPAKKIKFIEKIEADEKFRDRLGENLLLILDRLDDYEKAQLLAIIFKAYILNGIDYATFRNLARSIDRAMIEDLKNLSNYYENLSSVEDDIKQRLYSCDLVAIEYFSGKGYGHFSGYSNPTIRYIKNELGEQLIKIIFPD